MDTTGLAHVEICCICLTAGGFAVWFSVGVSRNEVQAFFTHFTE